MRIISGIARGTKLYTLEGQNTRPTLDRVKESIFNIIQKKIKDCVFLDLFSGSGAVGLEAASRGAKKALLCDNSRQAVSIIYKNIEKTHLQNKVEVYCEDYMQCLKHLKEESIDIIYLDPPYKTDFIYKSISLIIQQKLLNKDSIIIIETDDNSKINNINNQYIEVIDTRKYGRAIIAFLKIK